MTSNAAIIVRTLDGFLDHEVSLVIYGRAALALGFENAPPAVYRSSDVDVILRVSQTAELEKDDQFWSAQEKVNHVLEKDGLYMTHLFSEEQIFLRPDWEKHIVPITLAETRYLRLFRPATVDFILTKMMRGNDDLDMSDVEFMIHHDRISVSQLVEAMAVATIPDMQEYRDAFEKARVRVLELARQAGYP
jgi:hypothetical protein